MNIDKKLAKCKKKISKKLKKRNWTQQPQPMFKASNIHYEFDGRHQGISYGGIGLIHLLARKTGLLKVELIDNLLFRENTTQELNMAKLQSLQEIEIAYIRVEKELKGGFDRLENNVDDFLDRYYSLLGEYARLGKLLVGELETYMEDKMVEYFEKGDVFGPFQAELNKLLTKSSDAQKAYQEKARRILAQNRLYTENIDVNIVHQISLNDVMDFSFHDDIISLENRLLGSSGGVAAGGIITALVTKKIIAKIIAKNTVKTAAKALIKVIGGKIDTGGKCGSRLYCANSRNGWRGRCRPCHWGCIRFVR